MASENVPRRMVLEIKYVNANNAVIHTENSNLGWEVGFGTPLYDPLMSTRTLALVIQTRRN